MRTRTEGRAPETPLGGGRRAGGQHAQPLLRLQRQAGNRAVRSMLTPAVQRYQAGEPGHGGIEAEALRAAGMGGSMTEGEIGGVYLGNWMRDFSQVGDAHTPAVLTLLNVLSMGEFNRPVTAEQVGGYLPSEHLDNPTGGNSIEDPTATSMPMGDWAGLSQSQRSWEREQQTPQFRDAMAQAARDRHLPAYIETGKELARRNLARAARLGRGNSDGQLAMGAGLHAIEDYFAHSNFTDAATFMLAAEGAIPATNPAYRGIVARGISLGYDPSGGAGHGPRPEIMTGTYRDVGNKKVSLLEQLRSEVETGALRRAAVLGCIRLGMIGGGSLGASAGRAVVGTAGGALAAVGGVLVEGSEGGARGAAEGWRRGHGAGAVLDAAEGFFGGAASGAGRGGRRGWQMGRDAGGQVGASGGEAVGQAFGAGVEAAGIGLVIAMISGLIAIARQSSTVSEHAGAAADATADRGTREATANDRRARDTSPNHSQLAKDDTDHPLFAASRALAVHVDTAIGEAMLRAWTAAASADSVTELVGLVDVFVSNPADNGWWRPVLARALGA